jgi:hypothetical protein
METNFVLQSIAEQGREANERFEKRLMAEVPLDLLLSETLESEEVTIEQLEKRAREQETPNLWPVEAAFDVSKGEQSEDPPLTYADLQRSSERDPLHQLVARAVREELKRHASQVELDEEEEEPRETPQLPEDRAGETRFDRHVANMKARIEFGVNEGTDKAAVIAELRKIASSDYSRGIIDAAAELVEA